MKESNKTSETATGTLERRFDGEAPFVTEFGDVIWIRYRYRFTGSTVNSQSCGINFLFAIRDQGGVTHNWQCYYDDNLGWVFDDSEVQGIAGASIINLAVSQFTGQSCDAAGFCP